MKNKKSAAVAEALLAAVFYALNMPASKALLGSVAPTVLAGLLYLGAGAGIFLLSLAGDRKERPPLTKSDLPYTIAMILLDIAAPICLMLGLSRTAASNASLLNNFEIAATAVIAMAVFGEKISRRLWAAVALVTLAGMLLTFDGGASLRFSGGSLLVLLAAALWGLENNCTRKISSRDTFEIVTLKGVFSGAGSLAVGFIIGEKLPSAALCAAALLLGFVAYGLSIFFYIRAQSVIGAARTGAFYAAAPFVGALLSFVFLKEPLTAKFFAALLIMLAGSALAAADALPPRKTR